MRNRTYGWFVLLFALGSACGSDDEGGGGGGKGGSGNSSSGGSNTGGSNTGGSNTGGSNTGGSNTGGSNTGGSNTGGSNTGGAAGSATGGAAGSGTGGNTGGTGNTGPLDACNNAQGQLFPPTSIWNTPVDTATLDSESTQVINYLQQNHTASAKFQIDFSIKLLVANASTPKHAFTPNADFWSPDCDTAPIPVPAGGSIEGYPDYACPGSDDCHLLVVDPTSCRLYEMYRANFSGGNYSGGCEVVWDLKTVYPPNMRGDYCTSADAAGLPIAAHMFTADEIQAGEIKHAIRFILPNALLRADIYVHPATHSTGPTAGPANSPPYGARMRMKANVDISGLSSGAQVVAKALKKYGMIMSDGGNVTFTGMDDQYTTAKWSQVNLDAQDLKGLDWTDFEMVDGGQRYDWTTGDCNHVPITQ